MASFDIFKNVPEDYMAWENHIRHCGEVEGLSPAEREKAKKAFLILRHELGEDFLKLVFDKDKYHPLRAMLINFAPWTRKWITWFADALLEVKRCLNYTSLVTRLRQGKTYPEGMSVLEIAFRLSRGLFVVAFDPKVAAGNGEKVPDLKATKEGMNDVVFVEVTQLGQSRDAERAWRTMNEIMNAVIYKHHDMEHCAKIFKKLSAPSLRDLVARIEKVVSEARERDELRTISIPGVIEFGVAPRSKKSELEEWGVALDMKPGSMDGPPRGDDPLKRISIRIEREQKQLPTDTANIIVIKSPDVFFLSGSAVETINALEEEVYEYPHVLAVVVVASFMCRLPNMAKHFGRHAYIRRTTADFIVDEYLIIFNKYCKSKMTPETMDALYQVFERC